jgi:hypothetical protein
LASPSFRAVDDAIRRRFAPARSPIERRDHVRKI